MKVGSHTKTVHSIELEETERFDVESLAAKGLTVRLKRVTAWQDDAGERWHLETSGHRVLKSGQLGTRAKMGTWEFAHSFRDEIDRQLYVELSHDVRVKLTELGVTF